MQLIKDFRRENRTYQMVSLNQCTHTYLKMRIPHDPGLWGPMILDGSKIR